VHLLGAVRHDYLTHLEPVMIDGANLQGPIRLLARSGKDLLALEFLDERWSYVVVVGSSTYR